MDNRNDDRRNMNGNGTKLSMKKGAKTLSTLLPKEASVAVKKLMEVRASKVDRETVLGRYDKIQKAIDNLKDELVALEMDQLRLDNKYDKN